MIYSPKKRESYVRQLGSEEVGFGTFGFLAEKGAWNIFWLSEPLADISDTWDANDTENMPNYSELIWACTALCRSDPKLAEAAETLTPTDLIRLIRSKDYKLMQPYVILGEHWFSLMEIRAQPPRGIITTEGNVLSVNFGGHFLNLPKGINSAIIMPLSFDTH